MGAPSGAGAASLRMASIVNVPDARGETWMATVWGCARRASGRSTTVEAPRRDVRTPVSARPSISRRPCAEATASAGTLASDTGGTATMRRLRTPYPNGSTGSTGRR